MKQIDIFDMEKSISIIEDAILHAAFEKAQPALQQARKALISKYHPYRVYARTLESLPLSNPANVVIRPHNEYRYSVLQRIYSRVGLNKS